MRFSLLFAAFFVTSCAVTTDVVSVGPNQYLVVGRGASGFGAGKSAIAAAKRAQEFCAAKGQQSVVTNIAHQSNLASGGFGESDRLTFSCQ